MSEALMGPLPEMILGAAVAMFLSAVELAGAWHEFATLAVVQTRCRRALTGRPVQVVVELVERLLDAGVTRVVAQVRADLLLRPKHSGADEVSLSTELRVTSDSE